MRISTPALTIPSSGALKIVRLPDDLSHLLAAYGAPALLVRPDRYVHAALHDAVEVQTALATLPVALA